MAKRTEAAMPAMFQLAIHITSKEETKKRRRKQDDEEEDETPNEDAIIGLPSNRSRPGWHDDQRSRDLRELLGSPGPKLDTKRTNEPIRPETLPARTDEPGRSRSGSSLSHGQRGLSQASRVVLTLPQPSGRHRAVQGFLVLSWPVEPVRTNERQQKVSREGLEADETEEQELVRISHVPLFLFFFFLFPLNGVAGVLSASWSTCKSGYGR
ncbi:uncharacterized protein MCYG_04780 [Microsporum canis CBS 113480]|uniref:Uncharacterized protein n=1 Tax=Arthroderma otae (strain ATCC MYA-4605 / CBS 113480) TaxID=554155 RepID=C5FQ08_ARTOC|nr:uncharacterized protein MCYG_04780 [Microsporum canis CBS 113480]EEQ31961.1 predicted protein [Microsporum canis CBS 113480]